MKNIIEKIRQFQAQGELWSAISKSAQYKANYFYGLVRYTLFDNASNIRLHNPQMVQPSDDQHEKEVVRRIFESFKKMKEAQAAHPQSDIFAPSSLWQGQLDEAYAPMHKSLQKGTLDDIHYFLANFGAWDKFTGIEVANVYREHLAMWGEARFKNEILLPLYKEWLWFKDNESSIEDLNYPTTGNQAGFWIDGHFMGIRSFFNEYYATMLGGILDDIERPVVADLGTGYGLLPYAMLRNKKASTFIDFDLPETLCLAAYYQMVSSPEKKALLFGEEEYSADLHDKYDLIFMPSFEMTKLKEGSIDLFMNTNSLGEMNARSVNEYVRLICNSTKYFFHINHEHTPNQYDNETGLLCHEYPVDSSKFKQVFRYPDIIQYNFGNMFGWDNELFMYLYERR